jgi:hypothetical protein
LANYIRIKVITNLSGDWQRRVRIRRRRRRLGALTLFGDDLIANTHTFITNKDGGWSGNQPLHFVLASATK